MVMVLEILLLCLLLLALHFPASSQQSCHAHERSALLQFKQHFHINCAASGLLQSAYPKVKSWVGEVNGDCCSWDGVYCSEETGHVVGLDLTSSCLYGTFPPNSSLFSLSHLEVLNLMDNDFNLSRIPAEVGKLNKLKILNLSLSGFSGQIPSEISTLSQLSQLDLSFNGDSSAYSDFNLRLQDLSLERLVQNLTRLTVLDLSTVDISSPVPNILTNLTSIVSISLPFCNLYGEFPNSIFHLPRLERLNLRMNVYLEGFLPDFQQNAPLRELQLDFTKFSGVLPHSIGNLVHLRLLELLGCQFTGLIPSSLGNLSKITRLNLGSNEFIGDVPLSLANLTELQYLSLSNHNVRPKKLFSCLLKLQKLSFLGLASMNLTGEIPSFLANFTKLTTLHLPQNQLSGQIPLWLMNMTKLERLDLSNNQLIGPIPQEISQLTNLRSLDLGYNNIYGNLEAILKLRHLEYLRLSGLKLTFPCKVAANESVPKIQSLFLDSCNLTEFPQFLHNQDQLEELHLHTNSIHGPIPQWFVNLTSDSLQTLDLSDNLITGFEQSVQILPWSYLKILDLSVNKIQGSLPLPSSSMVVYQVSNNSFDGVIPWEICYASSLSYLDISLNNLSGQIPECISALNSLSILNLQGNNFNGIIPGAYPKFCNLKIINLSQNKLEGNLPRSLNNCAKLEVLDISNNHLNDTFSSWFLGSLSQLKLIDLSQNQLEGNMPRSLAHCTMLEVLDIGNNHVNDTFPWWLGSLPNLHILILRRNKFHGSICKPRANFEFQSLHIIDLSYNFHTGDIPLGYFQNWDAMKNAESTSSSVVAFVNINIMDGVLEKREPHDYSINITNKGKDMLYTKVLTLFRVIDYSSNNFTGKIPYSIGELRGLEALNLSNNNLHGNIPSSLTNLRKLESLDLSNNKLEGEIPQDFVLITSLEVFNVSHNHLVGQIPQGKQFNTFDNSSFEGNSGLFGYPQTGITDLHPKQTSDQAINNEDIGEDFGLIDWIIRSLGCVGGFVAGCAIGKYITDQNHEWFVETFGRRTRRRSRKGVKTKPRCRH